MGGYRHDLPQLAERIFLTDGGLETTLVFLDGRELPHFAAFDLLKDDDGYARLRDYYLTYAEMAQAAGTGFILESPTWRASPDWAAKLGYGADELAALNRRAIDLMVEVRDRYRDRDLPIVISGQVGPRGDGYDPGQAMTPEDAQAYHAAQIGAFAATPADMVTAITMTNVEEAIGVTRAAQAAGLPVAISFTVETDGSLPTGQPLGDAVAEVDRSTGRAPAYYMINCAHPSHFRAVLEQRDPWLQRLRGVRANASRRSHAELDQATELDAGDPAELGRDYHELRRILPQLTILGGCCGTDDRHLAEICRACVPGAGPVAA
jgi:homocysteine S-methyltransferase